MGQNGLYLVFNGAIYGLLRAKTCSFVWEGGVGTRG